MSTSARVGTALVGQAQAGSIGEILDAGLGMDLLTSGVLISVTLADAGSGDDTATLLQVSVSLVELGSSSEALGPISASLQVSEQCFGAEALEREQLLHPPLVAVVRGVSTRAVVRDVSTKAVLR